TPHSHQEDTDHVHGENIQEEANIDNVQYAPSSFNELEISLEITEDIVLHGEFISVGFIIEENTEYEGEYIFSYQNLNISSETNSGAIISAGYEFVFYTLNLEDIELTFTISRNQPLDEVTRIATVYIETEDDFDYVSIISLEDSRRTHFDLALEQRLVTEDEQYSFMYGEEINLVEVPTPNDFPYFETGYNLCYVSVKWVDAWGTLHPAKGVKVETQRNSLLYSNPILYTDENGYFIFDYTTTILYDKVTFKVYPESNNIKIKTGKNKRHTPATFSYSVSVNNLPTYKEIIIPNNNDTGKAFSVHQAMYEAKTYIENLSQTTMPNINVKFPDVESKFNLIETTTFSYTKITYDILIYKYHYNSWDVIQHEYGHFVAYNFDFGNTPGGKHYSNKNLIDEGNSKQSAIKLAFSEGWATYFAISSQRNLGYLGIPYVGDLDYSDLAIYPTKENDNFGGINLTDPKHSPTLNLELFDLSYAKGEASEETITGILIDLADPQNEIDNIKDINGNKINVADNVKIGHKELFKLIKTSKADTFSKLYTYIKENNIMDRAEIVGDIYSVGELLSGFKFAALLESPLDKATTSEIIAPKFSWSPQGGSGKQPNNSFKLIIRNITNTEKLLEINVPLNDNSYTLSQQEWAGVLAKTNASQVLWNIEARNTYYDQVTGPYLSEQRTLILPLKILPASIGYSDNFIIQPNTSIIYGFVVPETRYYSFETIGLGDTYGELFSSRNGNSLQNLIAFANDGGERNNFKIQKLLGEGQIIYIKITGNENGAVLENTRLLISTPHVHSYSYTQTSSMITHLKECSCGFSYAEEHHWVSATKTFLRLGTSYVCVDCGKTTTILPELHIPVYIY
ncbi:MAG: hypothetical protein LBM99_05585, partial [Bacillales bacterium]|nr:hypothetical protein [Bacillales bacterium]